jgi:hypothetical protein
MTYTAKLNGSFEVRFNVGISYSLLLLFAFKSYSTERQLHKAIFLKPNYLTGRFRWKKVNLQSVNEEHGDPRTSMENVS